MNVAVGASDHYGRAELVTLGLRDGVPAMLDRRRIELADPELPLAPFHHEAMELELDEATKLVQRVRRSVSEHAHTALATMQASFRANILALPTSPFEELPDSLKEILESRRLTNAADGMLYREALAQTAIELGWEVHRYPRKSDPVKLAAQALGVDVAEITARIAQFGREAGAPWRKDHKLAAAAALAALYSTRSKT